MKRTLRTGLAFLFIFAIHGLAQDSADELYIKAMTSNDPGERVRLLKQFIAQHPGADNENYAYATLCTTPFQGKTDQDTLVYGEKALTLGGLDAGSEYSVLITVAGTYIQQEQNLDRAAAYALRSIEVAKANHGDNPKQWTQARGAGLYVHGQALEKAGDLPGAVRAYVDSYSILKNKQIAASLARCGKSLYETKNFVAAERALAAAAPALGDFVTTVLLAKTLHRSDKKDDAVKFYKKAYSMQKSGEVAYNIGIILAGLTQTDKSLTDEAVRYLLDASYLSPANSKKAMELAERLYYNKDPNYNAGIQAIQEKTTLIDSLTETFNAKFGNQNEEDLSEAEKKEMESLLSRIETETDAVENLKAEQDKMVAGFNALIEETKAKLGVK